MYKASQIREQFMACQYDSRLKELYIDESLLTAQRERYGNALTKFMETFGDIETEVFSTPGRSEIGGNHTDHQHGMVLAASINLDAIAAASITCGQEVCILSEGYEMAKVSLRDLRVLDADVGKIGGLVKGIAKAFLNQGLEIGGFCAYITSDVLVGSGLSSSAAFEVMIGTIFSHFYNHGSLSPMRIAKSAQFAENVYFKKPCGLMDQMACAVGGLIKIDFLNQAMPQIQQLPVDFSDFGHSLCIVDTKGSHDNLTAEYAAIPYEMAQAAGYFGKSVLREVEEDEFFNELPKLRKALSGRSILRAIHFFGEEHRVGGLVKALENNDFIKFKMLIRESGDSSFKYLQNIHASADTAGQEMSVALAVSEKVLGEHGVSRVHGGGFAGTIQAFVEDSYVDAYREKMDAVFGTGACRIFKIRNAGSVKF